MARAPRPMNESERRRHEWRNRLQTVVLLAGMVALLSACGWVLGGVGGVVWALAAGAVGIALSPRASPRMALRLYGAQPISRRDMPELVDLLAQISERAGLRSAPELYYVPNRMLNAFALGGPKDAVIGVTDGLLRHLNGRELAGVLAHEVSHVRNNDLRVMALADAVSRLTGVMSLLGMMLLFGSVPLLLTTGVAIPWLLVLLLTFAPTLASLLQLALSRTREFEADLDAAGITGDPRGLASALAKLERHQRGLLETMFLPGRRIPNPSLIRTHPSTEERIRRLLALEDRADRVGEPPEPITLPDRFGPRRSAPSRYVTGLWR